MRSDNFRSGFMQEFRFDPYLCLVRRVVTGIILVVRSMGCRTLHRLPPVDISTAGWTLREGQAVWRETTNAPGIAGEIVIATHTNGDSTVQFTKTPLPFLAGQRTAQAWQLEFIPQKQI